MTDYAALALKLKPYILQWVVGTGTGAPAGGTVSAHALSGAQHTGQLAQSQATWAATTAALNAHALNANAHHAQVHGLDSTNHTGTLSWAKVNKSGSDLAHLEERAHASLTGIGPNDHHDQVHDITGTDHTIGGTLWDVVGKTAGGGLGLIASLDNVSGGQSVLLRSNAGLLTLKQGTATERLRTPLIDTASGNMTIQPAGDLLLSPGGLDAIVPVGTSLRSDNYLAGFPLAGFRIGPTSITGQSGMEAGSGEFDELRARIFVADETRVDRGQEYITKSYGVLSRAFTSPAAVNGTSFLHVENSPHIAGAVFTANDWVLLRYLDMSSSIVLTSVWGQVSAYTVSGLTGEQRWTFTLRSGGLNLDFPKGAMVVNFGASGQGYILSDAITATSPFIQIGNWVTNPYTPANRTVTTQIGRLDGVGFTGEYGLAASVSGFTTAGQWLKASTGGVAQNNIDSTWYVSGTKRIWIDTTDGMTFEADASLTGGVPGSRSAGINWERSGVIQGSLTAGAFGVNRDMTLESRGGAGGIGRLYLNAISPSVGAASVQLAANSTGGYTEVLIGSTTGLSIGNSPGFAAISPTFRVTPAGTVTADGSLAAGTSISAGSSITAGTSIAATAGMSAGTTITAATSVYAPRLYASAGGAATPGVSFLGLTNAGMFASANYMGLVKDGNIVLISRTEAADSMLNLGIGNTNNQNANIDFFANGAAPVTYDARILRAAGPNGALAFTNKGTGAFQFAQTNLGAFLWYMNGPEVMRINTDNRVGIGTSSPAALLDVDGYSRGLVLFADGDGSGIAATNGMTGASSATISTGVGNVRVSGTTARTNTHWMKFFVGTTIVWVPAWTTITG